MLTCIQCQLSTILHCELTHETIDSERTVVVPVERDREICLFDIPWAMQRSISSSRWVKSQAIDRDSLLIVMLLRSTYISSRGKVNVLA